MNGVEISLYKTPSVHQLRDGTLAWAPKNVLQDTNAVTEHKRSNIMHTRGSIALFSWSSPYTYAIFQILTNR